MAAFQAGIGGQYVSLFNPEWQQVFEPMALISNSGTEAIYEDSLGNRVVMQGSGLTGEGGVVAAVLITNSTDQLIWNITGLAMPFSELHEAVQADWDYGISDFMGVLMRGDDVFTGTSGNEEMLIDADLGDDIVNGLGGDDFFRAGPGDNSMNGGAGFDILAYHHTGWPEAPPAQGVNLDVLARTATNPWGGSDTVRGFETYWLSKFDDVVKGGNQDEFFLLLEGNDTVNGRGDNDAVDYTREALYGATKGISVNLEKKTAIDGFGDTDTLISIEDVVGSSFDDAIVGSKWSNNIAGSEGNDILSGRGGRDNFSFSSGAGHDEIVDFTTTGRARDRISLDYIDNVESFADVQAIAEDTEEGVVIRFDVDNDITLLGVSADQLRKSNFDIESW